MSKSFHVIADVEKGKVRVKDTKTIFQRLSELPDGRYKIVVSKASRSRTVQQNAYYWALISSIAEETGNTKDEIHRACQFKFLMDEIVTEDGEVLAAIRSTTELSTLEMNEYIEQIRAWATAFLFLKLPTFEQYENYRTD